jgi:transketolase
MTCWIPAFTEDVAYCLQQIRSQKKPAYLRLGLGISYPQKITISTINQIIKSRVSKITVIVLGPIVQNVLDALSEASDVDLFTILTVPLIDFTEELIASIVSTKKVMVIEEHVERGGLGEHILSKINKTGIKLDHFVSLHAKGYPSATYGDQLFHQTESGLHPENIKKEISLLKEI